MHPHEQDTNFSDEVITKVELNRDGGWTICHGAVCYGGVPKNSPVEPEVGMTARFYGGASPGSQVHGLALDGTLVFYKTIEQREAERAAWQADYDERQRKIAMEPRVPENQVPGFEWTEDMREISGFHGGYERTCRAMVSAGCKWWSQHPEADPQFHGFKNIYVVIASDNDDAKMLSKVILDAAGGDCTGAMHQACIGHIMRWHEDHVGSWPSYQDEMRRLAREEVG